MTKKPKPPKDAAIPNLISRELEAQFDQRFATMQTAKSKAGAKALFSATPEELGRAAVKGAKRKLAETITLSPEDQASFVGAILDPPPLAPAMERAFERRAELLSDEGSRKTKRPESTATAALADYQAGRTTDGEGLDQAIAKAKKTHKKKTPEPGYPGSPEYIQIVVEQEARQTLLAWKHRRTLGLEGLSPEDRRAEEERLAAEPSSAKRPIGRAVRVKENIPTWIYAGGWGDGPGWLTPGAQIWLQEEADGLVDYINGPRPLGPGEHRGGGFFPARYLTHVEDL